MFEFCIRRTALLLLFHAVLFVCFLNYPPLRSLSGVFFGSFVLLLNVVLSVFVFTRVHSLSSRGILLHRLALLLAIFIKGVNLLFLTYLGVKTLRLGVFPIVFGAIIGLIGSCIFSLSNLYFRKTNASFSKIFTDTLS